MVVILLWHGDGAWDEGLSETNDAHVRKSS